MKQKVCTAIGAAGGAIAALFGGWNAAIGALLICMAVDYLTGLIVAGIFHASPKSEGGVQVIIHHSDSYAANLVPSMIKMGIDVWQGVMTSNNIPELIEKYGDKITFMGGIDSATVDHVNWSREQIASEVERAAREYGSKAFIPCNIMGDPGCLYEVSM